MPGTKPVENHSPSEVSRMPRITPYYTLSPDEICDLMTLCHISERMWSEMGPPSALVRPATIRSRRIPLAHRTVPLGVGVDPPLQKNLYLGHALKMQLLYPPTQRHTHTHTSASGLPIIFVLPSQTANVNRLSNCNENSSRLLQQTSSSFSRQHC